MNTGLSKSRRPLLLVLIAVGCLVVIWRVAVWHNRSRMVRDAVPAPRDSASWGWGDGRFRSPFRPSIPKVQLSNTLALTDTNVPLAAQEVPVTNDQNRWVSLIPPAPAGIASSALGATLYAVVDLDRLLAAHPASTNSPEARMAMMARIKEVVAVRAAAHRYTFVFDVAATASANTPFILSAEEVPDLTDEVLKELAQ